MIALVLIFGLLAGVFFLLYWKTNKQAEAAARRAKEVVADMERQANEQIQEAFSKAQAEIAEARRPLVEAEAEVARQKEEQRKHYESEMMRIKQESQSLTLEIRRQGDEQAKAFQTTYGHAQRLVEQEISALRKQSDELARHYESECRKVRSELEAEIARLNTDMIRFQHLAELGAKEEEARHVLAEAFKEAELLRAEAARLREGAATQIDVERRQVEVRMGELHKQAEALLRQSNTEASRIMREAEARAEATGGDAYRALREKEGLEDALKGLRNIINGYGDRYIVPTRSLLDELAQDFSHAEAGVNLGFARAESRRLVEQGEAATCDYVETNRRETAIRFVVDAFNGRVDAILSRTKNDNHGSLEQEIRDAYSLVNLNGQAFRDARVLQAYLESRLSELKWAVIAQELRLKEREEQRLIKERIREEERARREFEKAMKDAEQQEDMIRRAMEKAKAEAEQASAGQREQLEAQMAALQERLIEAELKNQRAKSMAQQTRAGHVYIISNAGAFGEHVFKIGMTRRLEPQDRIKELGDASVPFGFDVHAMIYCDDAPTLEHKLHTHFDDLRLNKVNFRKEFFRVPIDRVRDFVAEQGLQVSFTLLGEAREFRETQAIERMSPEERAAYYARQEEEDDVAE
jgi:chromosome segregation ATPase